MSDIVEELLWFAVDWDGAPRPDSQPARSTPSEGVLRRAADEIARLRKERDEAQRESLANDDARRAATGALMDAIARAERAERERDRARAALPNLAPVIAWLENKCDVSRAVTELRAIAARIERARHRISRP